MGARHHRAVIEPIAHHGHMVALGLQRLQRLQFVLGGARTTGVLNTRLCCHALHRPRAVARQHLHRQARLGQRLHHGSRLAAHILDQPKAGQFQRRFLARLCAFLRQHHPQSR